MSETENNKKICMQNAEGVGEGEKSSGPWASENKRIKLGENLIDQAAILDSFCSKRSIFSFKRIFSDVNAEFSDFKIDCSRSEVLSSRTVASSVCC